MKIVKFKPEQAAKKNLCIITGVHGNEASLYDALHYFLSTFTLNSINVTLILANEEATYQRKRFIDTDLNRSFAGTIAGHEGSLASQLKNVVEGDLILDLHTHSGTECFALLAPSNKNSFMDSFLRSCEIFYCVLCSENLTGKAGLIEQFSSSVCIETGKHDSIEAERNAIEFVKKAVYFLEGDCSLQNEKVHYLLGTEFLLNPLNHPITINPNIKNFVPIIKGDFISEDFKAEKSCIPVLVSYFAYPGKKVFMACTEEII